MTDKNTPATEAGVAIIMAGVSEKLAQIERNPADKESLRSSAAIYRESAARFEAASRFAKQPKPTWQQVLKHRLRSFWDSFFNPLGFND